jgi:hypothetical protein
MIRETGLGRGTIVRRRNKMVESRWTPRIFESCLLPLSPTAAAAYAAVAGCPAGSLRTRGVTARAFSSCTGDCFCALPAGASIRSGAPWKAVVSFPAEVAAAAADGGGCPPASDPLRANLWPVLAGTWATATQQRHDASP